MRAVGVWVVVLAAMVSTGCGDSGRRGVDETAGTPYRDLEAGFAITVPAGWQATHGYGDVRLMLTRQGEGQAVRISVLWDRSLTGGAMILDDYVKFRVPRIAHFASERELLHQERAALNGEVGEAERVDYRYTIGPGHRVQSRTWLMTAARGGYALTLTADPERFDDLDPIWRAVEQTFQVLD